MDSSSGYVYVFPDISDDFKSVFMRHNKHQELSVRINDRELHSLHYAGTPPILADLIDLAVAINFADRLSPLHTSTSISVKVELPVRHPEHLERFHYRIQELMGWYTGSNWDFKFKRRTSVGRDCEHPSNPLITEGEKPTEVSLWSGGLDSLAGLQNQLLKDTVTKFILIGTGSNNLMHGRQKEVFAQLVRSESLHSRLQCLNLPIEARYPSVNLTRNRANRARGLTFLLIGSVCALLSGSHSLSVYENGIGAINLPFPGGLGYDHSRSVHPISLVQVAHFVSDISGQKLSIQNPFLFSTKAQMCLSLTSKPNLVCETISCDSLHREKPIQCGYCSSCLLRRHALAVAKVKDMTKYIIPDRRNPENRHFEYWQCMLQQVDKIRRALQAPNAWHSLSIEYPELNVLSEMASFTEREALCKRLLNLYQTYVDEWSEIKEQLEATLVGNNEINTEKEPRQWHQISLT